MTNSSATFDESGAVAYALNILKQNLPSDRPYHNLWHTEHDVMPTAVRLAKMDNRPPKQIALLRVAAAFHDVGFTISADEHEAHSIQIAQSSLPTFCFSPAEIQEITTMIAATKLPQEPMIPLARFLADADLDVLGRDDFLARNQALLDELRNYGFQTTLKDWYINQYNFVASHQYFTEAARQLRDAGKLKSLNQLKQLISQHS